MISFIWPPGDFMLAGTGGSETFTAGHVRELLRRGIPAQVVLIGPVPKGKRRDFRDLPFLVLSSAEDISRLSGLVIFINRAYPVPTKNKAALILHTVLPPDTYKDQLRANAVGKVIIATSIYSAQRWALYLGIPYSHVNVVYPFADPLYGNVKRTKKSKKIRIVFAGRFHPDKGIYTMLEMLHQQNMRENGYTVNLVAAGQHAEAGRTIVKMLKSYPYATIIAAKKTVPSMAKLLAETDILLMPSVYNEPFGMLSVEAQHAGCRVVASNIGGIPETNCGALTLVKPRSPKALAEGIIEAVALGRVTKGERDFAKIKYSLTASVDAMLEVLPL